MNAHVKIMPVSLILPESVETEQAVIGCLIMRQNLGAALFAILQPDSFYHEPHPAIWQAAIILHNEGRPITPLTLRGLLANHAGFLELGGHAYLANCAAAAPNENPEPLAHILSDLARKREAVITLTDATEAVQRGESLASSLRPVTDLCQRTVTAGRVLPTMADSISSMLKDAEDAANGKPIDKVTTGLKALDTMIGGLQTADFCVLAGRPGMGKSALAASIGIAAALSGRPTIFFSLEMTMRALLHRIGCDLDFSHHHDDPMSYSWFRDGRARTPQVERMARAMDRVPSQFHIHEQGGLTIHEIAAHARAFAAQYDDMGLVIIDYLQKVRSTDRYSGNKVQEVTEISGLTKDLAKQLGWPVVAGAQLSRQVESRGDQRPLLSDLRESGAIEQDADQVIGLYRESYYLAKKEPDKLSCDHAVWQAEYNAVKNRLDLIVLKNRHGAEGHAEVFCDMRASAIRDVA